MFWKGLAVGLFIGAFIAPWIFILLQKWKGNR